MILGFEPERRFERSKSDSIFRSEAVVQSDSGGDPIYHAKRSCSRFRETDYQSWGEPGCRPELHYINKQFRL